MFHARWAARTVVVAAAAGLAVGLLAVPASAAVVPAPVSSKIVSANPVNYTPHAKDGSVRAFAQIGSTVYMGGSFTQVRNAAKSSKWETRSYLIAFDHKTGKINTGFKPKLDGTVNSLAVNAEGMLIVGGAFKAVNGKTRRGLVALDKSTGATVGSWQGRGDGGVVRRVVRNGSYLYVAGAFHAINGTPRSLLARLNAKTGALDTKFRIDASGARPNTEIPSVELVHAIAVSPDGRTLVAVGNFTKVNGQERHQVVVVEGLTGTPTVANWSTQRYVAPCLTKLFPFYARDVDFSDDGKYFVIVADGGSGKDAYCDTVSRWETSTRGSNLSGTWVMHTGQDSVTALEVADNTIYVGGHFRWMNNVHGKDSAGDGAVDRYGYAALDPINGMPMKWNPTRSGAPTGTVPWGAIVWDLWRGPAGLYVGQDSDGVGREYHGRNALFPTSGGRTVPAVNAPKNTSGYLYLGAGSGKTTKRTISSKGKLGKYKTVKQANLTSAQATFALSDRLYWSQTDKAAKSGSRFNVSTFSKGSVGKPALGSSYNSWYAAAKMTGAFYLNGRMYYTLSGKDTLYYRYLEPDGHVVGSAEFTLPTKGVAWGKVRGMTWVNGKLVYGSTDGVLRTVAFDATLRSNVAVDGAKATVLARPTSKVKWSSPTLFFAAS